MAVKKDPGSYICSARGCEEEAAGAIVWANPKIHFGRTKTWMSCDEHRDYLTGYLGARSFPAEYVPLAEFLLREDS